MGRSAHSRFRAFFACLAGTVLWLAALLPPALAQDTLADTLGSSATAERVQALRDRLGGADSDDAQAGERTARLDAILATLAAAEEARTRAEELRAAKAGASAEHARLRAEIDSLREREPVDPSDEVMTGDRLVQIEGELAAAEARLGELTATASTVANQRQQLTSRASLTEEIAAARDDLARIDEQLAQLSDVADTDLDAQIRRLALEARRELRVAVLSRLEADNASVVERSQTLQLRADLIALEQAFLIAEVEALQKLTGQRRVRRAMELRRQTLAPVAAVPMHPIVEEAAEENLDLVDRLSEIASAATELPEARARAQQQLSAVTNNLAIASQLTELGDLQRAGETLRRLRANLPVLSTIRADIEATGSAIIEAGTDQLLAQESQRLLPLTRVDPAKLLEEYRQIDGDAPDLSEAQARAVRELYETRRTILSEVQEAATAWADDATQLKITQDELLVRAEELQGVLDRNLLKARSAEPMFSLAYPAKLVRGTAKALSPQRGSAVLRVLREQASRPSLDLMITLGLLIIAGGVFAVRDRTRARIADAAGVVRRVRLDNYLVTPRVAAESLLLALPVPLALLAVSYLIRASDTANPFVLGVGSALSYLALFLFALLALRAWSQKGGLFDKHIRIPDDLRRGVQVESRWFVPVAGTAFAVMAATNRSRDIDLYEGVSLTAFVVAALALGILLYRLIHGRREAFSKTLAKDGNFYKYRHIIGAVLIGTPFIAALFAASGYYSTTEEVLQRFLETLYLAVLTFVVYGILRRTVNITHRRLSLKQAMEKREAALKARRDKEAAEDGEGEAKQPPPVDYDQIDLEETSRQTRQLLSTAAVILFLVAVWFIWRDLLPALGVFDSVELYRIGERLEGEGDAAIEVPNYITLWDVIRAGVTVFITVLAARNLPGFLEIFVLNRTQLETGIRYAIVTILGYIIVGIGIFTALNQLGVQWGSLGFLIAALGVGIGFGLQEIIANFISGLIILFERPIRVGDYVSVGDQSGTVSNIRIRATTLTDLDNKEILIPNKEFITTRVTNWTLTNSVIRLIIPVGIAYGSDTRRAQKTILETIKAEPKVLDNPAPQVIFVNFGDSSLDFEMRVFIRSFEDRFPVINAIHTSVNLALEREGISIPFPQRDLHLVSADGLKLPAGASASVPTDPDEASGMGDDPEPASGARLTKGKGAPVAE